MSAMTHDLLVRGVAAARSGDNSEAQRYLTRLLGLEPTPEEQSEAWLWLAELSENPAEQRGYLSEVLARNPGDARARRKMAEISGALNPAEIINPDKLQPRLHAEPMQSQARRFTCQACGARMIYSADGKELLCENCGSKRAVGGLKNRISQQSGANFSAAMATSVGHLTPNRASVTICQGCGAEFQMPARVLSTDCPYCGSSYASGTTSEKEIIQPARLVPFKVSLKQVRERLIAWFSSEKFKETPIVEVPAGIYVPVWKFVVGGQLSWACSIQKDKVWTPIHDSKILNRPDILVYATQHLPDVAGITLFMYDLTDLVPYDPHYLSDWLAETYQIPVGDASLSARQQVLENEKERIRLQYDSRITNLRVNPANMAVDSYELVLLPLWITRYTLADETFDVVVNGQTGQVTGQKPAGGMSEWISKFFSPNR